MTILQTTYLLGLIGILVPVLIHLWSRKNRAPIPFGSIRFITTTSQRALRKIVPSDPWLLLLRSIIILLMIALLSDIRFDQWTTLSKTKLYVDSLYASNPRELQVLQQAADTAELQWLPDLPPEQRIGTFRTLTDDNTVIISPWNPDSYISNAQAAKDLNLKRLPFDNRSLDLYGGIAGEKAFDLSAFFSEKSIQVDRSVGSTAIASVSYFIEYENDYKALADILRSALESIHQVGIYTVEEVSEINEADVVIQLVSQPHFVNSKKLIQGREQHAPWLAWSDDFATLSNDLTRQDAIRYNLINQVYQWLSPYKNLIISNDIRQSSLALFPNGEKGEKDQELVALSWIWWSLLLVGIATERWFALR